MYWSAVASNSSLGGCLIDDIDAQLYNFRSAILTSNARLRQIKEALRVFGRAVPSECCHCDTQAKQSSVMCEKKIPGLLRLRIAMMDITFKKSRRFPKNH